MTAKKPQVLLPIHLDRWRNPIASKLREVAVRMPDFTFHSFSSPRTEEDRQRGTELWARRNLHRSGYADIALRRFDIVHHASSTPANLLAVLTARARGLGRTHHVFTASMPVDETDSYFREFSLSVSLAHHVLAGSKAIQESLLQRLGRRADGVLPNGVDAAFFSPAKAGPPPQGIPSPYFLFVGAMLRRKRTDFVVELAEQLPEHQFVLAGRRSGASWTKPILREIEERPNVRHLGLVPKATVRDLMAHAHALLFPSEKEGFANVVLEAGAMGLPVLTRPRSSMPELIREGVTGWLISIADREAWIEKLREIVAWPAEKRGAFGGAAREWAVANHSWDEVARTLTDYYWGVLA